MIPSTITSKNNPWLIAVVVSIVTFMEVLDTTIVNVSLLHIAGSLAAGYDESTWVLTSYLVANAIVIPLSGWLSDKIGRKRYFVMCIVGFTAASFACGAATSLTSLIVFRILQGAAGGGLQPTQQAIILDIFPPEKRGAVFAITGITMVFAPILGPTLGGIITDHISWRWVFYINVPVGIMATFLVLKLVPKDEKQKSSLSIDYYGIALIAVGIGALQIMLDKGQQEDWFESSFIISFALVSFVSLVVAVIWMSDHKDPVIDFSLFKDRGFAMGCCLIFIVGFVLYGGTFLLPTMLQSQFGYTATLSGLVLSPAGLATIFLMPVSGKLITIVQARYMIYVGMTLSATGMFGTALVSPQTDFETFLLMRIMQVIGLPFLFIPISTLAFFNVPKNKSNKASALFSLFRNIGGSVGITLISTYQVRQSQIRQSYLAENIIPGSPNYENYLNVLKQTIPNTHTAERYVNKVMESQAAILGYADSYLLMSYIILGMLVIAFFMLPANKPGGVSHTIAE